MRAEWLRRITTKTGTGKLRLKRLLLRLLHLKWVRALRVLWHKGLLLLGKRHIVCILRRHLKGLLLEALWLERLIETSLSGILLLHWGLCCHRLLIVF